MTHRTNNDPNNDKAAYAKEERDDDIEYTRIPFAEEDSEDYDEDYDEDDEIEEEEDEILQSNQPIKQTLLPYVPSDPTTYVNINITADDIAYLIGHVERSGPNE
jgi:hypothetical protein